MPERIAARKAQVPVTPPLVMVSLDQFNQMGSNVAYLERTTHSKQTAVDTKRRELEQAERNYKDVLLKWGEARDAYKVQVQLRAQADRPKQPESPSERPADASSVPSSA